MLLIVACVLFVLWLLGVTAFKMTRGLIHLVLIIAIIVIVLHFVRGG
ncbi:MAG: lmo0937 family membrane protein [bacterium]